MSAHRKKRTTGMFTLLVVCSCLTAALGLYFRGDLFVSFLMLSLYPHVDNAMSTEDLVDFTGLPSYEQAFYNDLTFVLAVIIIVTNFLIVILSGIVICEGRRARSLYVYFCNMAVANVVIGIVKALEQYFHRSERSDLFCYILIGFLTTATLTSVYNIGCMANDRFLTLISDQENIAQFKGRFALLMVLKCWLLGSVTGFLPAIGVRTSNENREYCSFRTVTPTPLILATVLIGMLPLVVLTVFYGFMLKKGKKSPAVTVPPNSNTLSNEIVEAENYTVGKPTAFNFCGNIELSDDEEKHSRAKRLVYVTAVSYFVSWVPYFIALILYVLCDSAETPKYCYDLSAAIENPLAILKLFHSLFFPFIYTFWHYECILFGTPDDATSSERKLSEADRQRGSVTSWISIDLQS